MIKDDSVSANKATGFYAYNGMICVGDHVEYEDGWLTFRTIIVEQNNVYGFFLDGEFYPLAKFISDMSAGDMKIRDCAEIDFTIINPSQKGKPAKTFREDITLPNCPICGRSTQIAIEEDPTSYYVECSPGCTAPKCYHLDYHETAGAWTDFVQWYQSFFKGYYRYVPVSHHDLVFSSGQQMLITQEDHGSWIDVSDGIYSFMDINDLRLQSGQLLNMEELGRTWLAFRRMAESEIEERNRPVNLLSKRRALKHCHEVLERLQEHNEKAFRNDPHLWQLKRDMMNAIGETDEVLDSLLWK